MSKTRLSVNEALDLVREVTGLTSDNRLAGALDVSRQALHKWRTEGRVPALRACQMEVLSGGKINWRELCPEVVEDLEEFVR